MAATATTRQRSAVEAALLALVLAPSPRTDHPTGKNNVYARLSLAIRQRDKEKARRIYYDEILPDKRFSRGEVIRLSYRLGAIDEGDRYLATCPDL